jgi:transglutaminase-like putative cysteine protease
MDDTYLKPTSFIDCDHAAIADKCRALTAGAADSRQCAVRIFYFVRDAIRYNAFADRSDDSYRASHVLAAGEGYCVQKAVLLVALARAAAVPARLRFADILAHLTPPEFVRLRGSNLFAFHGLADLFIDGAWVKATPTYDIDYCTRIRTAAVEFDGMHDAMLPAFDLDGRANVEYIRDRGFFDDLPLEEIRKASVSRKYMRP